MKRALRIAFVAAGGPKLGAGHIMRSAALAAEAVRGRWAVEAFLSGDAEVHSLWRTAAGEMPIHEWRAPIATAEPDLVVLDYPADKHDWITRVDALGVPVVVLDDRGSLDAARLTVCPALHDPDLERADLLSGPRFSILSRPHLEERPTPPDRKRKLLLSLGGADPHGATLAIAPLIDRVLERMIVEPGANHAFESKHVVLGRVFDGDAGAATRTLEAMGWRVHRALDRSQMARLMSESRFAVMGFGTSLTELAWHRTPHASLTHHEGDRVPAERLEAMGIGRSLGWAGAIDPKTVETKLETALRDANWLEESAKRAFAAIDSGRGATQLMARFESLVRATRRANRSDQQAPRPSLERRSMTRSAATSMSSPRRP